MLATACRTTTGGLLSLNPWSVWIGLSSTAVRIGIEPMDLSFAERLSEAAKAAAQTLIEHLRGSYLDNIPKRVPYA